MQPYSPINKVLTVALSTLLTLTFALAYSTSILSPATEQRNIIGLTDWSVGLLIASSLIGALLIIAYGTPIFVALWLRNAARWPYVLLLGATPGLLIASFFGWGYSYLILGFGLAIATVVRLVCGLCPTNSAD